MTLKCVSDPAGLCSNKRVNVVPRERTTNQLLLGKFKTSKNNLEVDLKIENDDVTTHTLCMCDSFRTSKWDGENAVINFFSMDSQTGPLATTPVVMMERRGNIDRIIPILVESIGVVLVDTTTHNS